MPMTRGFIDRQKEEYRRKQEAQRTEQWQKRCSKILKRMFRYYGESQETMARCIGKSRAALNARLSGTTPWTAQELVILAGHFNADNVTRAALLGGSELCRWEM